jgi:hypothetical protein
LPPDYDSIVSIPQESPFWWWHYDIDYVAGGLSTCQICTSGDSPAGTDGFVVFIYNRPGQTLSDPPFICRVVQNYFMGDMHDPLRPGYPDCFVDALDMSYLIDYVFVGGPAPHPPENADIDCDGFPTALDLSRIIGYIFEGSVPPPYCDAK